MPRSPPPPAWEPADADEDGSASSTRFTATATGWHVLKVEGYSQIRGLVGVARRLKSCPFVVGEHTWCITYFPDGLTADTADWISFALRLERRRAAGAGTDHVTVRARSTLLDDAGDPMPSLAASYGAVWTFTRTGESGSYARFMERKEFESNYVKDDGFSIRCDVTVVEEDKGRLSAAAPPSPDLHRHLGDLLASGDGADVTLEVGGEAFAAHRSVLAARSPVFRAVFFGGPHRETGAARLSVDDVEPRVFRALLHFIYTDSVPEIDERERTATAEHLLVAADRYGVGRLKSICEYVLCRFVDTSSAVTTLVLAERHGCQELKEACFKTILRAPDSYEGLMVGDDFRYLASTCPSLLQELRLRWVLSNVV